VNYMVALDGSSNAKSAFYAAISILNKDLDGLLLALAIPDMRNYMNFSMGYEMDTVTPFLAAQKKEKEVGQELLRKYGLLAKNAGVKNLSLIMGESNHVGDLLCRIVEEKSIDVLVVGRRGMGTLKRLLVGSTSEYCVENAPCTVMVIKGESGPAEEHVSKKEVLELEEQARMEKEMEEVKLAHWESKEEHSKDVHTKVGHEAAEVAAIKLAIDDVLPTIEFTGVVPP